MACAQEALGRGVGLEEVATVLGVSEPTLSRWLERQRGPLRRVEVVAQEEAADRPRLAGALVLVTPHGYRVEGLELGEVAALLEALR
ncbi:MAG: hypothetical protein M3O15_04870 [Acidobacteriota bacterium]|nr:hypothetical protein [Acidobacteriota bacterium]